MAGEVLTYSFYGLGGSGGFGNDWMDAAADTATEETGSTVHRFDQDEHDDALRHLLRRIDDNDNQIVTKSELKGLRLRVIGYSFGGIEAVNFVRQLNRAGKTVEGFELRREVPVRMLVTLDPVEIDVIKETGPVTNNVRRFCNYFQRKAGETEVELFLRGTDIHVRDFDVDDPLGIKGNRLDSNADQTKQDRVERGKSAERTVRQRVDDDLDAELEGKDVNHGSLPFWAFEKAVRDLTL